MPSLPVYQLTGPQTTFPDHPGNSFCSIDVPFYYSDNVPNYIGIADFTWLYALEDKRLIQFSRGDSVLYEGGHGSFVKQVWCCPASAS